MSAPIEGILNIHKPTGLTSHDVVNRVRRLSGIRRVGHAGTLDPLATGVLVLALGRATRLLEYLVGQSKRYLATVRLGQETDSYDAEGRIVAEWPVEVTSEEIEAALAHFRGEIEQKPPLYSAVKKGGQPLYKLARQGAVVEPPTRRVTIFEAVLADWDWPEATLDISCSSGTYIRSLAHDLGQYLGCGGHIAALQRAAVGSFTLSEAIPLDELTPENLPGALLPPDAAVAHLPAVSFPADESGDLRHGRRVPRRADHPDHRLARAYDEQECFIGILTAVKEQWQPRKIL